MTDVVTEVQVAALRKRAWHYLSHEVAAAAGMSLAQLQQFAAGAHTCSEDQLRALARRMRMEVVR